ncbi:MAG: RdgB/HAM1 family non-canonical purine NTP pyrophosphatase [Acidimicrobiales bacterium]|nr:RdgB/HAM1 family non-canonical purine NTP pyrophosphatase [Acidimicrobiales bacterium]
MTEVVLATANEHKAREIREVLRGIEILPRPSELGEIEEIGDSLTENALLKADAVKEFTSKVALADDTGLEIDALEGKPGVHSARFAHPLASDAENVAFVLKQMENHSNRQAKFITVIALSHPNGDHLIAKCEVRGEIAHKQIGSNGFGYDSIFIPLEGDGRTFGEMSSEEKNSISHRGRALRSFFDQLKDFG